VDVPRLAEDELVNYPAAETSASIRERVCAARTVQLERYKGRPFFCNAQMGAREIREVCVISEEVRSLLRAAIQQLSLSARAYDRILKVSRTIADLADSDDIKVEHLAEAIQYRSLDRENWAG